MARHVFILGAGASREAGGPLMADFLDKAEDLSRLKPGAIDTESFELAFEGLAHLQAAQAKAQIDTLNVESVFGAFEMAKLVGRLGEMDPARIERLPEAITKVIVQTVEQNVKFSCGDERIRSHASYEQLADLVLEITQNSGSGGAAIFTFNYDIALEHALNTKGQPYRYCITPPAADQVRTVDVLKLHGSVNWQTGENGELAAFDVGQFMRNVELPNTWRLDRQAPSEPLALSISKTFRGTPFIVPPTWSKLGHYSSIAPVWRRAGHHLSEAENIYVMGFSLPPSDTFFRYLYALGTAGRTRLRQFRLYDPDTTGAVEGRFRDLLGQSALARFMPEQLKFGRAITHVRGLLKKNA